MRPPNNDTMTHHWLCPSCGHRHPAPPGPANSHLHPCPRHGGISVPLVPAAQAGAVRHVPVVRDDYVGDAVGILYDNRGRPIAAVRLERADGSNDTVIHAPTAMR